MHTLFVGKKIKKETIEIIEAILSTRSFQTEFKNIEDLNRGQGNLNTNKMKVTDQSNFAPLPDKTEAGTVMQNITPDANGKHQGTYQKVLVDEDEGAHENDGDPKTFQLSDAGAASIMGIFATEVAAYEASLIANAGNGDNSTDKEASA